MAQLLEIHTTNPQPRLINSVITVLNQGGIIAYPTDSAYALGCQIGNKQAQERISQLRDLDKHHNFTLMCQNLSELGTYARVSNTIFRLLKAYTPGPYTFILPATQEVPKRLQNPKRKTIGLRVPDYPITLALLAALGEPLMSVTLILPGQSLPLVDPQEIYENLGGRVDLVVSGGICDLEPTTVVDLVEGAPQVIRVGKGDPAPFL